MTMQTTEENGTPNPSWRQEVIEGISAAEPEWSWETSEEVIDVKLTDGDMADMLRANGADEDAKTLVDREIDATKARLKELKAESEAFASGMKDRNRQGAKGIVSRKAHWKVGTCFALNTVQYVDPDTGVEVMRRSLTQSERQLELGVDAVIGLIKPDAQLSLGDAADPASMTDPEALLAAAQKGDAIDPTDHTLDNDGDDDEQDDSDDGDDS